MCLILEAIHSAEMGSACGQPCVHMWNLAKRETTTASPACKTRHFRNNLHWITY